MPEVKLKIHGRPVWLLVGGDYKPGDPAPIGYVDRQEWHKVQHKAGYRQRHCGVCQKWLYDFEECGHDKTERLTLKQLEQLRRDTIREMKASGVLPRTFKANG